ncbi:MAG TPA: hypothetical protein VL285_10320, partial [Bryobacteraceae bacterium]|nr:hypothetical protein [Bryobacteraceae bacterium]
VTGTGIQGLYFAAAEASAPRVAKDTGKPVFSVDLAAASGGAEVRRSAPARAASGPAASAASQPGAPTAEARQNSAAQAASPAAGPNFVPIFRAATITDGVQTWGLNHTYFATRETAQWIASRYGTGEVVELPFGGSNGPFSASATEFHVKLPNGRLVNAGMLAGYYERNPEALFPGLAEKLIRNQLAQAS